MAEKTRAVMAGAASSECVDSIGRWRSSTRKIDLIRWLSGLLVSFVAVLVAILLGTTTSASVSVATENRVGAISHVGEVPVEPPEE